MSARPHLPLEEFLRVSGLDGDAVRQLVADGSLEGVRTDDGVLFAVFADRLPHDLEPGVVARIADAAAEAADPDPDAGADAGKGWSISW